ncbi:phosphotransferase [Nonomuraea sp. NEAU-A123]|uniref:phosphotransferase n=1 Tax=Nonomuraea sp. NEAU-A123 TaxID=2839649 RepID=UPI001BE3D446|nr:phosphotransferase [Nonomuraea sp. NEAU-A123]MBT2229332.1 phosphotransferase [Nonomuraea sp. NEAU-A123]
MRESGRRAWHELPGPLAEEVEGRLGSAVRRFEERRGGFSYGVLGVATLDGGERVFVKAVPADSDHVADYRSEAIVAAALPAGVPAPRFRFSCEADGWVLLCFDVAPGSLPHEPWRPEELAAALRLVTLCARELTPSPIGGLPTVADRMAGRCETWQARERDGATGGLGTWERARLGRLAEVERDWASLVVGDSLLHFDPRFDNLLITPHGRASLVDWGRSCIGPAWADLVCLLLESDLGDADPEELFAAHPLGRAAEPERVDALLVAFAGYWTRTAGLPGPPHAPHLRVRRGRSRQATIDWLRRRWR